jgi:hypothetical protein
LNAVQGGKQIVAHRYVIRVQAVGSIERHPRNAVAVLEQHGAIAGAAGMRRLNSIRSFLQRLTHWMIE